jgi:3-dehydroquinate synthetase
MLIAARAAEEKGLCAGGVFDELREMLAAEGLPVTTAFTAAQVARAALNDKKRRGNAPGSWNLCLRFGTLFIPHRGHPQL